MHGSIVLRSRSLTRTSPAKTLGASRSGCDCSELTLQLNMHTTQLLPPYWHIGSQGNCLDLPWRCLSNTLALRDQRPDITFLMNLAKFWISEIHFGSRFQVGITFKWRALSFCPLLDVFDEIESSFQNLFFPRPLTSAATIPPTPSRRSPFPAPSPSPSRLARWRAPDVRSLPT